MDDQTRAIKDLTLAVKKLAAVQEREAKIRAHRASQERVQKIEEAQAEISERAYSVLLDIGLSSREVSEILGALSREKLLR